MNIPIFEQLQNLGRNDGFTIVDDLGVYVSQLVGLLLLLAAIAAFAFLVWGGLRWIMSSGDKAKVEESRSQITNALIGLAVVASAWAVFLVLDYFFGLGLTGGSGASTSTTTSRGVCIDASRCRDGAVGSPYYCQNSLYTAQSFGSCGTGRVYCDCVVK